jgi:hypothetical protein
MEWSCSTSVNVSLFFSTSHLGLSSLVLVTSDASQYQHARPLAETIIGYATKLCRSFFSQGSNSASWLEDFEEAKASGLVPCAFDMG